MCYSCSKSHDVQKLWFYKDNQSPFLVKKIFGYKSLIEFYLISIYKFYPRYVFYYICFYATCRLWISIIGPTYCKTCLALDSGTYNIFKASFPFCQTDIPNNNEYTYLLHVDVYRAKFSFVPVKVPIMHLKTRSQIKLVFF